MWQDTELLICLIGKLTFYFTKLTLSRTGDVFQISKIFSPFDAIAEVLMVETHW